MSGEGGERDEDDYPYTYFGLKHELNPVCTTVSAVKWVVVDREGIHVVYRAGKWFSSEALRIREKKPGSLPCWIVFAILNHFRLKAPISALVWERIRIMRGMRGALGRQIIRLEIFVRKLEERVGLFEPIEVRTKSGNKLLL